MSNAKTSFRRCRYCRRFIASSVPAFGIRRRCSPNASLSGLAVADDPGDGRSFGQHRCQLIAKGLVRSAAGKSSRFEHRFKAVVDRFAEEGLSAAAPWLKAGSSDAFHWSASRRVHTSVRRTRPGRRAMRA